MSEVANPEEDVAAEPRRRWLRWVGVAALTPIVLVVLLLVVVLYTGPGTRWALRIAADFYSGMIDGEVTLGEVEGALALGTTIEGVHLRDGEEGPLVDAERLYLGVDVGAAFSGTIEVGTIEIDGLVVRSDGRFSDLAPIQESPPPEPPPTPNLGPDLPFALSGTVRLRKAELRDASGVLVGVASAELQLWAEGTDAVASLRTRATVPAADLQVHSLVAEVAWTDPKATVRALSVQSDAGDLWLDPSFVDFDTMRFELGALHAQLGERRMSALVGHDRLGPPTVRIRGGGFVDDADLEAFVQVPHGGSVMLLARGGAGETPWVSLLADAEVYPARHGGLELPALSIEVAADAHGTPGSGLEAQVHGSCQGCERDLGTVELDAQAAMSPAGNIARAEATVHAEAIDVRVDAFGSPQLGAVLSAAVDIDALAELAPILDRFAPGLDIAGSLALEADCAALLWPRVALCQARGGIERGRPVRQASLDVSAGLFGSKVGLLLHALSVKQGGIRIRAVDGPAEVAYAPGWASVRNLRAEVMTESGAGSVQVDGQAGFAATDPIAAKVRAWGVGLSAVDAFVPGLGASGVVSASLSVAGTQRNPVLAASVRGRGVGAAGFSAGDVVLDAQLRRQTLVASVTSRGGDLGDMALEGRVPVMVDVPAGQFGLLGRQRSRVSLQIEGAKLEALSNVSKSAEGLRGFLDLSLVHEGRLARPTLELGATLRDGMYQDLALPKVAVAARYEDQTATLEVAGSHPEAFDILQLQAQAPVRLNLARGSAGWNQDGPHSLDLNLDNADLSFVEHFVDGLGLAGTASLTAHLEGTASRPEVDITVQGRALQWQDRDAGELSLAAGYREDEVTARLWAAGPDVAGIGLDAVVPLTLDVGAGTARWHPNERHEVEVAINEVLVRPALAWVPDRPPLDLDARVSAVLSMTGTATEPVVALRGEVEDVVYGGRVAGSFDVEANYVGGRGTSEVVWNADTPDVARVRADVPVFLDLAAAEAKWDSSGEHHVRIAVPRLDPGLVEPFIDVGSTGGAVAVHVVADGSLEDFKGSASIRGYVKGREGSLPVDARVVVRPQVQSVWVELGAKVRVEADARADVAAIAGGAEWTSTAVEGRADIDKLQIALLSGFVPMAVQDLRGVLDSHVRVSGTLGKPEFDGTLVLDGGAATVVPARVRLRDAEVKATFNERGLDLDRLAFQAGDGRVTAKGAVNVVPNVGVQSKLRLDVSEFPLRAPGLPRMALSTGLDATVKADLSSTDVLVNVDRTRVDVYASKIAAAAPIPSNENVVLADLSKTTGVGEVKREEVRDEPSSKHVRVVFDEPIRIVGPSIDMTWSGAVETTVREGEASTSGALTAKKGVFSLLGNDFDLDRGTVTLADDGSVVPFVDVEASTTVDDLEATLAIRGPLLGASFELSSVPALPQSEIFTVLVMGTTDTQGADSEDVQNKGAAVLAAMSNAALQRELGDTLHVDKIGLGFGDSSDQPILSVGKNITDDVYAETEYHHNAPAHENRVQLEVEYEFAPRWSLETFFGDAAEGGVAVFWGLAFDRPATAAKKADATRK